MKQISAFELLGLESAHVTAENVKKAYYRRARFWHPDASGTVEAFLNLKKAAEILLDETLRERMGHLPLFVMPQIRIQPSRFDSFSRFDELTKDSETLSVWA